LHRSALGPSVHQEGTKDDADGTRSLISMIESAYSRTCTLRKRSALRLRMTKQKRDITCGINRDRVPNARYEAARHEAIAKGCGYEHSRGLLLQPADPLFGQLSSFLGSAECILRMKDSFPSRLLRCPRPRSLTTSPHPYFTSMPVCRSSYNHSFLQLADSLVAPHVGHLYTMVLADVLKRWQQLKGKDAILATGTDEHGLKVLPPDVQAVWSPC
jgi:hypothetical protein